MELIWLGGSTVQVSGKDRRLLMDPPRGARGEGPNGESAVLTYSEPGAAEASGRRDACFVISGPGEYEVDGLLIVGVAGPDRAGGQPGPTLYSVNVDGVNLIHSGLLNQKLSQGQVEALGEVGILVIGLGDDALTAAQAAELVVQLEPNVVVPLAVGGPGRQGQAQLDRFLEEMGAAAAEPRESLDLASGRSASDEIQVVRLLPAA